MKPTTLIVIRVLIFIVLVLHQKLSNAQLRALPPSLFTLEDISEFKVEGSTRFLESLEVEVFTLKPGRKILQAHTAHAEDLIIVKEGQLGIDVNGRGNVVGPGSVAFVMPGETYAVQNKGTGTTIFYRLKFKSKNPLDKSRGQSNGGSFAVNWDKVAVKENEHGSRRDFFDRPTATCEDFEMHVTTLNEGLPSHPPHTHIPEEIILMIKGVATMSIDNKNYVGSAGDLFFLPSGSLHGIKNSGKGPCEYFAFQWK
jgi:(S)-ureidoglycine aminohydrolase